jgi:hypothetical protein
MLENRIGKDVYRQFCNYLKHTIDEAKKNSYSGHIMNAGNKIKATWEVVNEMKGKKKKNLTKVSDFGTKDKSIPEILTDMNEYLIGVCKDAGKNTQEEPHTKQHISQTFSLYLTDCEEVKSVIKSLNNTMAVGYDEVPVSFLKKCSRGSSSTTDAHNKYIFYDWGVSK